VSENLYGKALDEWNRLAGLSEAQAIDIEIAAQRHTHGHYRGYQGPEANSDWYAVKPWDSMNASERLCMTFDLNAPCCAKRSTLGRKRTVREIMRDDSIAEQASVRVGGDTPRRMLRELAVLKGGWQD
jgi:hypothetical protein